MHLGARGGSGACGNPGTWYIRAMAKLETPRDRCFPAIESATAHTLVLGSLPGRRSLDMRQYYAHPQNAFWKIVAAVFDAGWPLPYERAVEVLTSHGVAVWDVLAEARRPGSLDSAIIPATARVNDFAAFFRAHPRMRRVFFNGRKAEELYRRAVLPGLSGEFDGLSHACLPSTSPAHAGVSFARKLAMWQTIGEKPG